MASKLVTEASKYSFMVVESGGEYNKLQRDALRPPHGGWQYALLVCIFPCEQLKIDGCQFVTAMQKMFKPFHRTWEDRANYSSGNLDYVVLFRTDNGLQIKVEVDENTHNAIRSKTPPSRGVKQKLLGVSPGEVKAIEIIGAIELVKDVTSELYPTDAPFTFERYLRDFREQHSGTAHKINEVLTGIKELHKELKKVKEPIKYITFTYINW